MPSPRLILRQLWDRVRAPKVDDAKLEEALGRLRAKLPAPVFWLLGKAQSGKTSIIRALTGSSRAEIGNGFRPCTRTSQIYPFPDEETCFVRFLDTRGLGEVHYDPTDDMQVLERQSHCLIVVMKAMDHAQKSVVEPLTKIAAAHPRWPLIVAQTSLHEGYPWDEPRHVPDYPFDQTPLPPAVPSDLARSLLSQRQALGELGERAKFVPVDFTLPEDGFQPEHYGLDALWRAVDDAVPLGLRAMLADNRDARLSLRDVYFRAAHPHIISYAAAAGAAAGVPVPMVDIPLFIGIQGKMFHTLASIYGQEMKAQRMAEVLGTLGVGVAGRLGVRELLKFIPGVGSAVSAMFAAASTYALGCTLCAYFGHVLAGDVPDAALLRKLFDRQYEEGRRRLREYLASLKRGENGTA